METAILSKSEIATARRNSHVLAKYDERPASDWDGSYAPSIYALLAYELECPSAKWESSLTLDLGAF